MTKEQKERCKKIMREHLAKLNWPNVVNPDELVMKELEPMFRLLLKENLVKYTDWNMYYLAAEREYVKSKLR